MSLFMAASTQPQEPSENPAPAIHDERAVNCQIIEAAESYRTAYNFLVGKDNGALLWPAIHCAAIGIELFLKAFSARESFQPGLHDPDATIATAVSERGHILHKLFDKAPEAIRNALDEQVQKLYSDISCHKRTSDAGGQNSQFRSLLEGLDGRLFITSRYPYEATDGISGIPMRIVSGILDALSCVAAASSGETRTP